MSDRRRRWRRPTDLRAANRHLADRYLETADGRQRHLSFGLDPEWVRRIVYRDGPGGVVAACMPAIVDALRAVKGRPDPEQGPTLLSEREMRRLDVGAVLAHPRRTWLVIPIVDRPDAPDTDEGWLGFVGDPDD